MTIWRDELTIQVYAERMRRAGPRGLPAEQRAWGLLAYNQHMRAFLTIAAIALAIGFWVYAVVDCAMTDARRARGISKSAWVLVTIFVSVIGGVLWFAIGKDRNQGPAGMRRQHAPDDDPTFLRSLSTDAEQEARIRKLEREIAELDDDSHDK